MNVNVYNCKILSPLKSLVTSNIGVFYIDGGAGCSSTLIVVLQSSLTPPSMPTTTTGPSLVQPDSYQGDYTCQLMISSIMPTCTCT